MFKALHLRLHWRDAHVLKLLALLGGQHNAGLEGQLPGAAGQEVEQTARKCEVINVAGRGTHMVLKKMQSVFGFRLSINCYQSSHSQFRHLVAQSQ